MMGGHYLQVMFIKEHMKKDLIQYKNVSHFIEVATVDAYQVLLSLSTASCCKRCGNDCWLFNSGDHGSQLL